MNTHIENAIALAVAAHRGQESKDREPYVLHPIRVMLAGRTDEERIVGVLHDVIEDTHTTPQDLADAGFTPEIIAAVDAMTHRDGESYDEFISRCEANPIARRVKLNDIADNMNLERIPDLKQKDFDRYIKYRAARARLQRVADEPSADTGPA